MKYAPALLTPFVASLLCIRRRTHIRIEHREPKDLNQLSVNTTTACSLFALSLRRFRPLACLFSTACSLFSKNTRGGGITVRSVDLGGSRGRLPMPETVLRATRVVCPSATPPRSRRLCGIICSGLDRLNALSPLPLITSPQPSHFHAITHSFAQRRPAKPCPLKRLRTLSITTGVYPPALLRIQPRRLFRWPTMLSSMTSP
jgi:hypothetical protein